MGDDTGCPSSAYPGGSEDDFNELRADLVKVKEERATIVGLAQKRAQMIVELQERIKSLEAKLAWCSGEGHSDTCPQCYDDCNCGKEKPDGL